MMGGRRGGVPSRPVPGLPTAQLVTWRRKSPVLFGVTGTLTRRWASAPNRAVVWSLVLQQ